MGMSYIRLHGLIVAIAVAATVGRQAQAAAEGAYSVVPQAVVDKIDAVAYARPPNLYGMIELANQHRSIMAEIAAIYAEKTNARGEEAGLIAATVAAEANVDATQACAISAAVTGQIRATPVERKIICSKVARSMFPRSSGNKATESFVECLASKFNVSADEAQRIAGASNWNESGDIGAPMVGRSGNPAVTTPASMEIGGQTDASLAVQPNLSGTPDANSASSISQDHVLDGDEATDEFDSGRKKRNKRTSRSE